MVGGIFLAAALTYVLPAGQYDRQQDEATGREVVVAGTYHAVARETVDPFAALVAIPRGMEDAGSVIFLVFLIGGAFTVVDRTGALRHGVESLMGVLGDSRALVIPISCLLFAAAGALENMQEEIIALVPVLLILTRRAGFDALTAVAMSMGAAAVGAAFSPLNPFQVGIAQKLADVPLMSGWGWRTGFLAGALVVWIALTMRHALRTASAPQSSPRGPGAPASPAGPAPATGHRHTAVLILVLVTFALFVYGILHLGWDFDQMSALFLAMGIAAGIIAGMGVRGTTEAFVEGFREMAFAALLIGFARAIYVVLDDGLIIDTIVNGLFTPLAGLPLALSATAMVPVQALIHIPVSSVSGQAVLTMPVLVPLSDLLGLSRQVTILAYQYGAGLADLLTPTNGALMAILAASGVRYDRWLRFAAPAYGALVGLGLISVVMAIVAGL